VNIFLLPCSHCTTLNPLELDQLTFKNNEKPVCKECLKTLSIGQPLILNDNNFSEVISNTNLPIIVDFWSIGCGPCKAMLPAYTEASEVLFPKVILAKVNIETSPETTEKYDVRGLPTLILFKNGQSSTRKVGAMTSEQIVNWTNSVI